MENESYITCPLCSQNKSTIKWHKIFNDKQFTYKQCMNCGLIFLSPLPNHKEVVNAYYEQSPEYIYQKDYFNFLIDLEKKSDITYISMKLLKRQCGFSKEQIVSAFDIGAGAGTFMFNMRKYLGWKVAGIEPGDIGQKAAKKFNLNIKQISIEDFIIEQRVDVVTLMSVIEHTPKPFVILQKVRNMLKDNGMLVLETPNANSLGAYLKKNKWSPLLPPAHMVMYTPNTIISLLEKTGFKKTKIFITGKYPFIERFSNLSNWLNKVQLKYEVNLPMADSMVVFAKPSR